MKTLPILALFATLAFAQHAGAQYLGPKTVYILPMARGLDQYLAQALTNGHVLQVVADPKLAEVVMTDNIGPSFEQTMKEILPAPADLKKSDDNSTHGAFRSTTPRGTVFLVEVKSRKVVWSDYREPPNSNSASTLNREAGQIIKKLLGQ